MSTPAYKKRARQLQQQREKKQREYEKMLAAIPKPSKKEFQEYVPSTPVIRETPNYPSLSTSSIPAGGSKKESPKYTGDYIIGIATMHKSNLVPVGRGSDPKEYAQMRRN